MTAPRYSADPIFSLVGDTGLRKFSRLTGVSESGMKNWRKVGLTSLAADRAAVALGLHPVSLWPTWFDDADNELRCRYCAEMVIDRTYCGEVCCDAYWLEKQRDARAQARWWKRLDRYRLTVFNERGQQNDDWTVVRSA